MRAFDSVGFVRAIERAARIRSKTMKDVSRETGVSETTLSRMVSGDRMCDAASMAALGAWAGINPARFSQPMRRLVKRLPDVRLGGA